MHTANHTGSDARNVRHSAASMVGAQGSSHACAHSATCKRAAHTNHQSVSRFESCTASYGQSWLRLPSLQLKESILKFERNVTHNEHQQASFFRVGLAPTRCIA